jgi:hypothetical protein
MSPEIAVTDAEAESDNINIGEHGADGASDPYLIWDAGAIEAGANSEGRNRV